MILDFNLVITANRTEGFTERDRLIELLTDNGYRFVTMENGTRVLMENSPQRMKKVGN